MVFDSGDNKLNPGEKVFYSFSKHAFRMPFDTFNHKIVYLNKKNVLVYWDNGKAPSKITVAGMVKSIQSLRDAETQEYIKKNIKGNSNPVLYSDECINVKIIDDSMKEEFTNLLKMRYPSVGDIQFWN